MSGRWRLITAQGEAAPESVRRFALRARQRRLRAAVPWLVLAGIVAVLAGCAGIVGFTGVFGVRQIVVNGTAVATPEEVREAADIRTGTPLARVDTAAVATRIERLASVRSAAVRRRWPGTLVVQVTERVAAAVVPVPDGTGFLVVDETGVAFDTLQQRPADLSVVRVTAPSATDPATKAAMIVLRSLPAELLEPLGALVAEAPARIRLELTDGRVVVWGDSTANDAKARVAIVLLGGPGKVLDVSAPGLVSVR